MIVQIVTFAGDPEERSDVDIEDVKTDAPPRLRFSVTLTSLAAMSPFSSNSSRSSDSGYRNLVCRRRYAGRFGSRPDQDFASTSCHSPPSSRVERSYSLDGFSE